MPQPELQQQRPRSESLQGDLSFADMQSASGEVRMSAAQLTEATTQAQLQAEVYRCVSALLAAEARGRLSFRLPGFGLAAPESAVAPALYCLYQDCPAPAAPPVQQRR